MTDPLEPGVTLVVEQLRRVIPGGIGTYATGLISGLLATDSRELPPLNLVASAPRSMPDPLDCFGLVVTTRRLPGPLLTRAWDHGLASYRAPVAVVHGVSLALPKTKAPLVAMIHDLGWRSFPAAYTERGRRWHEAALHRAARHARHFVTPSASVADELADSGLGIKPSTITVIEHGADHLPPPDRVVTDQQLVERGITGDFLLSVGTLEPRKNLARLFAAYRLVRARVPNPLPLVVVGPAGWGTMPGGDRTGIELLGAVSSPVLAGLYERASTFVYVPLLEGFGLPVVEAMRAGLPVCSTAVPAAAGATQLVDADDEESIADGLMTLMTNDQRRDALRTLGQARAEGLTWQASAAAHLACWREVAAQ